jgi:hypothetical protein
MQLILGKNPVRKEFDEIRTKHQVFSDRAIEKKAK